MKSSAVQPWKVALLRFLTKGRVAVKTNVDAKNHMFRSQGPCAEPLTPLNLKAPSDGSVNNYKFGTAVIKCAGR